MSSVLSQEIMSKYGSKTSSTGKIFLDVSGFDSGEKIIILTKVNGYCGDTSLR